MTPSEKQVTFIGFGEAGQSFAGGWDLERLWTVRVFDIKMQQEGTRAKLLDDCTRCGVTGAESLTQALAHADIVISVVTADQALTVAREAAADLPVGALYLDLNSVAPETKRASMALIKAAGGRYADVAVMAPVDPLGLRVPVLISGENASAAADAMQSLGFNPRIVDGDVGVASSIKMIRSIMVKGIEALTAECMLSAFSAGVQDEVIASLDASWPGADWARRADYNLDRMMIHGLRRAEEMKAARETAIGLGLSGEMAAATIGWQARVGALKLVPPAPRLEEKAKAILGALKSQGKTS
jgi:3-hydroxyisobutyrate dehydrogenase-like beta-hydroxyacid dehydrogenase